MSASGYTFGANQGLNLTNALINSGIYDIKLTFHLDDIDGYNGYRKLIDFKNRTDDQGVYLLHGHLNFFSFATVGAALISAGQDATIEISRDGAGIVNGSVNGVNQFTFSDSSGAGIFSSANQIIRLFEDDTPTGLNEASSGFVSNVRIAGTVSAVAPLPSTAWAGIMLFGGIGAVKLIRRRAIVM